MQQNPSYNDRRRARRRLFTRLVSFSFSAENSSSDWYLGSIMDASTGGVKIHARRAVMLRRGQRLTVLCVPDRLPGNGREAVQIHARVAWQDSDSRCFGLEYI